METKIYKQNTNKTKDAQLKQYNIKNLWRYYWLHLGLSNYSWVWYLLNVWFVYLARHHWRKLILRLPLGTNYRYLLGKGWEFVSAFPSQLWDHIWFEPVQAVCMLPQFLWVHIYISAIVSERHCFSEVIHPVWLYHLSASSSLWIIEPWGEVMINERVGKDIPLRTECWVPLSLYTAQLWVSVLVPIWKRKKKSCSDDCSVEKNSVCSFREPCHILSTHVGAHKPL